MSSSSKMIGGPNPNSACTVRLLPSQDEGNVFQKASLGITVKVTAWITKLPLPFASRKAPQLPHCFFLGSWSFGQAIIQVSLTSRQWFCCPRTAVNKHSVLNFPQPPLTSKTNYLANCRGCYSHANELLDDGFSFALRGKATMWQQGWQP